MLVAYFTHTYYMYTYVCMVITENDLMRACMVHIVVTSHNTEMCVVLEILKSISGKFHWTKLSCGYEGALGQCTATYSHKILHGVEILAV